MTPDQFAAKLQAVADAGVRKAMAKAGLLTAADAEGRAKERARTVLSVRTGNLRRSIQGTHEIGTDNALTIRLRAGGGERAVKYARIQELGGTVTPKTSKYLRIPLGPAKTKAGVDRFAGPLRQSGKGQFRVFKAKSGKLFLVKDVGRGKSKRMEFWYILVKSVTIKAHPYLYPSITEASQGLAARMGAGLTAEFKGGAN